MEGVESAFLVAGVEGPGFSTVEQLAEHAGLVYLNMVLSQTLFPRLASAAALPMRLFCSVFREIRGYLNLEMQQM